MARPLSSASRFAAVFSPTPFAATLFFLLLILSSHAAAARVLIVGDTKYALVADVVSEIENSLQSQSRAYATADVRGRLGVLVEREDAEVVVALGVEAITEAMRLPPSIAVVYGLVVIPPKSGRAKVTGVYMSPPVSEYLATVQNYFPAISKVSVVGSLATIRSLSEGSSSRLAVYPVATPNDLVNTVNRLTAARALLLLPDVNLLTGQVMSSVYLFSFQNNIPLLGISEAHVRQGALFALVFDPRSVGRQIGEKVQRILGGVDAQEIPASPPRNFYLYVNGNTARKMGLALPAEMVRKARRVY